VKEKMMVELSKFDAADYLKTPLAIAVYLTEAFETNDPAYICVALDTVARAKGIADVAKATDLSRESLYKTFKETAKPEFDTVRKVMRSLGVKLVAEPIEEDEKVA
jgi:probable addiction module antidote protein